uniref:Uncharacterized protein n=2 Tax=Picea TaxID=3328 RepID=A0A117NGP6_PICGL|nr:hypothetical protein ABT39_MTgene6114 [Picea glauca]QHR92589.1 hypothetical protein Q903MT_gene6636 [Picea sitchensis]
MSGLVKVKYCNAPHKLRYLVVTSFKGYPSSFLSLALTSAGVSMGLESVMPNFARIYRVYFCCDKILPFEVHPTSSPRKSLRLPRSFISKTFESCIFIFSISFKSSCNNHVIHI